MQGRLHSPVLYLWTFFTLNYTWLNISVSLSIKRFVWSSRDCTCTSYVWYSYSQLYNITFTITRWLSIGVFHELFYTNILILHNRYYSVAKWAVLISTMLFVLSLYLPTIESVTTHRLIVIVWLYICLVALCHFSLISWPVCPVNN